MIRSEGCKKNITLKHQTMPGAEVGRRWHDRPICFSVGVHSRYTWHRTHDWVQFSKIDKHEDQLCIFRCVVENARIQSAKLVFLTLSQGLESIQMVVSENREEGVSKAMVRFAGNIPPESVCTIFGIVKRTSEKIKSTTVQGFEV